MKKIVAFKKDLLFKTKVSEITSISLEHKILNKDDDLVSGEFLITGDYKMTEGSINREKYDFILPFDIALNSSYNIDTVNIDIDNFYYEILNNDILKVHIDLLIEAEEKELVRNVIEDVKELDIDEETFDDEIKEEEKERILFMEEKIIEKPDVIDNIKEIDEEKINNNDINLFNIDSGETYSTYYVYIVKEDDTIDKILEKYSITKEELELYNNIESIKTLDKIIIPTNGR